MEDEDEENLLPDENQDGRTWVIAGVRLIWAGHASCRLLDEKSVKPTEIAALSPGNQQAKGGYGQAKGGAILGFC